MMLRTVMGTFNQAKALFFCPSGDIVLDFGSNEDVRTALVGYGREFGSAAAAYGDCGDGCRHFADNEKRWQSEGSSKIAKKIGSRSRLGETADPAHAVARVIRGGTGEQRLYTIETNSVSQNVADAIVSAVEVGVAGDDTDPVGNGHFDEPAGRRGGIYGREGLENQRMMGDDGISPPVDGLLGEVACGIKTNQN